MKWVSLCYKESYTSSNFSNVINEQNVIIENGNDGQNHANKTDVVKSNFVKIVFFLWQFCFNLIAHSGEMGNTPTHTHIHRGDDMQPRFLVRCKKLST